MGGLLCCAACETASCACSLCKCCLPSMKMSVKCANIIYLMTFILSAILAVILQYWGAPQFQIYSFDVGCTDIPGIDIDACKGDSAVYRISIGLTSWFVLITLGTALGKKSFHVKHWFIKLLLLIVLITGLFFVTIDGINGFIPIARVVSALFLILQIVAFIDAAYHWNSWVKGHIFNEDETEYNKKWMASALIVCAVLMLIFVTSTVLLYVYYGKCTISSVFITVTAISCIGTTIWQLNTPPEKTDSTLLTSCIVSTYAIYLCWASVHANPDPCNTVSLGSDDPQSIILGMAITVFSLSWTCYSASTRNYFVEDIGENNQLMHCEEGSEDDEDDDEDDEDMEHLWFFHLMMATGSIYMAMLLTNWGTHSGEKNNAQMWVSIISQWVSIIVYAWTLMAPSCLPDREFY